MNHLGFESRVGSRCLTVSYLFSRSIAAREHSLGTYAMVHIRATLYGPVGPIQRDAP